MSWKDRQKVIELMMLLVQLSNKAYEEGILSLDDIKSSLQPEFLRKAIEFLVEGYNEIELNLFFNSEIDREGVTGVERQNVQLIKEGILSILRGEHGKLLFQNLLLILGDEFFEGIDENLMY